MNILFYSIVIIGPPQRRAGQESPPYTQLIERSLAATTLLSCEYRPANFRHEESTPLAVPDRATGMAIKWRVCSQKCTVAIWNRVNAVLSLRYNRKIIPRTILRAVRIGTLKGFCEFFQFCVAVITELFGKEVRLIGWC